MSVALAEPRRKEKHGPDPRNTFWSKDETKFGFRMLQSMGWKKGKGLGAKETGMTEHLKAGSRKNNDVRGFGCSKKDADNWIAHQDDFESILASLNESADASDTSSQPAESTKASHAMEEKSRSSRSRVHYHKFIQSKDLSTRSAEDLNCIFGRRKKPSEKSAATTTSEANSDENSSSDDQKNDSSVTKDVPSHGVKTITSSCSVQEYFAMKMAALQGKMKPATPTDTDVPTESNCNDSETALNHSNKSDGKSGLGGADVGASEDSGLTEKQKRKKKKKKHRQENQENDVNHEVQVPEKSGDNCTESCQEPNPVCVDEQRSKSEKKEKRKKKRGSSECESVSGSQLGSAEEPEVSHEAEPTAKKAKKRKSVELDAAATEQEKTCELDQIGICEHSDEATQKKKKKKKKNQKNKEEDALNSSILRQEKDGKNRRRKSVRFSTGTAEIFMIPNKEDEKAEQEEEETMSKKQSKKRKRQKANAEEEMSLSADSQPTAESAQEDGDESLKEEDHTPKKKKRKTEKTSKKKSKAQKENQENPQEQSAESELPQSVLTSSSVDTVKEGSQTESENPAGVSVPLWKGSKSSQKVMSQEQVDHICKLFVGSNLSSIKGYGNWS